MGRRILLTGMGGELGTRVTGLLEDDDTIEALVGIDLDPPRGRIPRAEFHRFDPEDRARTVAVVRDLEPTGVLHLGVYEPGARIAARRAPLVSELAALAALGAAAQSPSLDRMVIRSGIEVYGRPRRGPHKPDETVTPAPTTPWGRALVQVEETAVDAARAADVPLTILRFAPVVGPHIPSPLGRILRLPAVPLSVVADPPFSLLHQDDAAAAAVRALDAGLEITANVVGPGGGDPVPGRPDGEPHPRPDGGRGVERRPSGVRRGGRPAPRPTWSSC